MIRVQCNKNQISEDNFGRLGFPLDEKVGTALALVSSVQPKQPVHVS
jgi:hypothetical protein